MHQRNIYLKMQPISQALEKIKSALQRDQLIKTESIPTEQALGRVLCKPVFAQVSAPTFHCAAMDGIAVRAEDTFGAREGLPKTLGPEQFVPVNTGDPMPRGFNAVIMIEYVEQVNENHIQIETPAFPWQHVRRIGEDIVASELLLPQHRRLTPFDLGALLSAGIWEVNVYEQIRLAFIPTGDEVLDYCHRPTPKPGQVIESNSLTLISLATELGCSCTRTTPVPDNKKAIKKALQGALSGPAHIILTTAGSSAGTKDFTKQVMAELGQVLVHGIAAMPGKPSLLGTAQGKLLVGIPGYPVSAVICFEQLVKPLIAWLEHQPPRQRPTAKVFLSKNIPSKLGQEEFIRLGIGKVGDRLVASPLSRGAGMISTLVKAQGVMKIPLNCEGLKQGSMVPCDLLVPPKELEQILVCIGSHDNLLDLLANELQVQEQPVLLSSSHVGSMGGLMAIKDEVAHLAGTHLFDPESKDYNFPFIQRYLPQKSVVLINLAIRRQGLIIARGNPKGIHSLTDLTRPDVTFINRQRGSGTRILLDYELTQAGISPQKIPGYQQEEFTHMAVAANVLTGAADCGLGILAAAKALNLDFVPLTRERYDLLIPEKSMDNPKIQTLLRLIKNEAFQNKIKHLGGYETQLTGQVMTPGQGLSPTPI